MMSIVKGLLWAIAVMEAIVTAGCGADKEDTNPQKLPSESAGDTRIDLKGQWELAGNNAEGCLAEWKFLEDPTSKEKPLSFHEMKEENVIQVWFGVYELQRDGNFRVTPLDPKGDPFMANAIVKDNSLQLRYNWNKTSLRCTYEKNGS